MSESAAKKARTDEAERPLVAIAFDIDGVFKYGREWSPKGAAALARVRDARVPFVFVTNGGGGLTEAAYADAMSAKVGAADAAAGAPLAIPPEQMILSYSPWARGLAPALARRRVLLVGDPRERVLEVAASYGLERAVHYRDFVDAHPTLNPFPRTGQNSHTAVANAAAPPSPRKAAAGTADGGDDPFAAVLVMCDPYHWFEALQTVIDLLCSPRRPLELEYDAGAAPLPVHFSNPDFLWKAQHPFSRFGQGAFKLALRALYTARLRALRVDDEARARARARASERARERIRARENDDERKRARARPSPSASPRAFSSGASRRT